MKASSATKNSSASAASPHSSHAAASIGGSFAAGYEDEPIDAEGTRFRGRFKLIDVATGEPISGRAARVRSTAGLHATETTDAEGFTQWIERDAAEALAFDLPEDAKG